MNRDKYKIFWLVYAVIAVILVIALVFAADFAFDISWLKTPLDSEAEASFSPAPTFNPATPIPTAAATNSPTEAPDRVVATATVGMTGDVLIHDALIRNAKISEDTYDFSSYFASIAPYYQQYDYMIANLEVTLGGTEAGKYCGYPIFNCPDSILDALLGAGVDMMLTANNHSYDTHEAGFLRTQEQLKSKNFPYIGTRLDPTVPFYTVKEINGIRIGFTCYTYETARTSDNRKSLNGIPLTAKASQLVNSFNYNHLDDFYADVTSTLSAMKKEGADYTVFFLHWGQEYTTKPIKNQKTIAAKLNELGVDCIVGGHPHVIEPVETLVSDSGHETVCLYSMGNAVSNQRRELMDSSPNGFTEDGMIFSLSFDKYGDGRVLLREVGILPTWVDKAAQGDRYVYRITPLDVLKQDTWTEKMKQSYDRTQSIVSEGLVQTNGRLKKTENAA